MQVKKSNSRWFSRWVETYISEYAEIRLRFHEVLAEMPRLYGAHAAAWGEKMTLWHTWMTRTVTQFSRLVTLKRLKLCHTKYGLENKTKKFELKTTPFDFSNELFKIIHHIPRYPNVVRLIYSLQDRLSNSNPDSDYYYYTFNDKSKSMQRSAQQINITLACNIISSCEHVRRAVLESPSPRSASTSLVALRLQKFLVAHQGFLQTREKLVVFR